MPVDVVFGQFGKLGNTEPGIKQGPDDELFFVGFAGVGQAVGLVLG